MADFNLVGRIRPVYKGVWNAETAYVVLETVTTEANDAAYIAIKDVPAGTALTNAEYWGVLINASGLKGADGMNGADGVGISHISPISVSDESGGLNKFRIVLTDGSYTDISIRNGSAGSSGYTPIRGTDYWTEEDQTVMRDDCNTFIATELAKRGQLKPEFANSVEECTDTSKLYVLPDGYVYGYMYTERAAYTNLANPDSDEWLTGMRFSSGSITSFTDTSVIITNPIPCKPGDTIRMRGVNLETNISSSKPRTYMYSGTQHTGSDDYYVWTLISNGYGTWDDTTKTATFQLVDPDTGAALGNSFDNIRQNMRLASGYASSDVIITVNQEIVEGTVKEYAWTNTGHAFVPADYEDRIVGLEETSEDHESRLKLLEANAEDGGVPDYWLEHLQEKAESIQLAMESAGRNKSAFLWYTDAHWVNGSSKMSPVLLNYLYKNTPMNKVNFGGDIVGDPAENTHDAISYVYEWRRMMKGIPNHHSVIGNHDNFHKGSGDADYRNMVYSFLIAPEESPDMVMGDGLYYYIDNPCEKTRYLYLDSGRLSLSDEETAFMIDALKTVPVGWHVVAISHIWFQYTSASAPTVGSINPYMQKALNLFDAYNARESGSITMVSAAQPYDFTACGGNVEFCIGGHIHVDYDISSADGIPVILTASDVNQERSGDEEEDSGTLGTTTEAAVFGIIADYANSKVTVVGVGRGTSREIAY